MMNPKQKCTNAPCDCPADAHGTDGLCQGMCGTCPCAEFTPAENHDPMCGLEGIPCPTCRSDEEY